MSEFVSLFDIFKVGLGPSSSHTMGPMKSIYKFLSKNLDLLKSTKHPRLKSILYGSLALTGKGHCTDKALVLGAFGCLVHEIDFFTAQNFYEEAKSRKKVRFKGIEISFDIDKDIVFEEDKFLTEHPNGMKFIIMDNKGKTLKEEEYFSIGGGFIATKAQMHEKPPHKKSNKLEIPYPFETANELFDIVRQEHLTIDQIVLANEKAFKSHKSIRLTMDRIIRVMLHSVEKGIDTQGVLPGLLQIKRRAATLYQKVRQQPHLDKTDFRNKVLKIYAIAVNEENAAGGVVVTAPTNGSAGIIAAIVSYYNGVIDIDKFLLVATAIAILYQKGASFSGAQVGCQGEIGVASSMAAGALTACLGGTVNQIENAAEIAMEHSLGLTCDPVYGLVQIPCIERNAMGVAKVISAVDLAMLGEGQYKVSLDRVIKTMKDTGADMATKYKETSQGGLALNFIEC